VLKGFRIIYVSAQITRHFIIIICGSRVIHMVFILHIIDDSQLTRVRRKIRLSEPCGGGGGRSLARFSATRECPLSGCCFSNRWRRSRSTSKTRNKTTKPRPDGGCAFRVGRGNHGPRDACSIITVVASSVLVYNSIIPTHKFKGAPHLRNSKQ